MKRKNNKEVKSLKRAKKEKNVSINILSNIKCSFDFGSANSSSRERTLFFVVFFLIALLVMSFSNSDTLFSSIMSALGC